MLSPIDDQSVGIVNLNKPWVRILMNAFRVSDVRQDFSGGQAITGKKISRKTVRIRSITIDNLCLIYIQKKNNFDVESKLIKIFTYVTHGYDIFTYVNHSEFTNKNKSRFLLYKSRHYIYYNSYDIITCINHDILACRNHDIFTYINHDIFPK